MGSAMPERSSDQEVRATRAGWTVPVREGMDARTYVRCVVSSIAPMRMRTVHSPSAGSDARDSRSTAPAPD